VEADKSTEMRNSTRMSLSWSPIHKHCRKTCPKTRHKIIITQYLRCHKIILRHVINEFTEFIFNDRNFFMKASCCHVSYGRMRAAD